MQDLLKRVLAAVPLTALTAYVTSWSQLLHVSYLTHPAWELTINHNVQPFSIMAVLIVFMLFYPLKAGAMRWLSVGLICLSVGLMLVCLRFSATLDNIPDPQAIESTIRVWKWFYMAAVVVVVSAATACGLWLTSQP